MRNYITTTTTNHVFSKPPQAPSPIKVTTSHLVLATLEAPYARCKGKSLRTRSCTHVWELRRLTLEKFEEKGQLGLALRSSFHQGLSCKSPSLFSPRNTRLALPLTDLRDSSLPPKGTSSCSPSHSCGWLSTSPRVSWLQPRVPRGVEKVPIHGRQGGFLEQPVWFRVLAKSFLEF